MADQHSCPICEKKFETSRGVKTHCARVHTDSPFGKVQTTCETCEAPFEYYPSNKRGTYCSACVNQNEWQTPPVLHGSENPRWNGGKRAVDCVVCAETVERHPSNIGETVLCSEPCRKAWLSDTMRGSNHPNWNGGDIGPYGPGWTRTRRLALRRDSHSCRLCNRTADELGRNPDIHHIVPVRWFTDSNDHAREDAHTLDNVIALCPSCHKQAESGNISKATLRSLLEDTEE